MIYEVRTYRLKPGSVPGFEENFAKVLPHREKYSKLGAFWHTEFGPLNQVIHVWPYESMGDRTRIREEAAKDPNWPPHKRPRCLRKHGIGDFHARTVHAPPGRRPGPGQYLRDADLQLQIGVHGRSD